MGKGVSARDRELLGEAPEDTRSLNDQERLSDSGTLVPEYRRGSDASTRTMSSELIGLY